MKKTLCIIAAFCLTLIGLGSCSWFESDSKLEVQAKMTCHYPANIHPDETVQAEYDVPYDDIRIQSRKDNVVGNIIDDLRENVPAGFSDAELVLKYYTEYGVYRNTEYYAIWWSTPDNTYFFELIEDR